MARFTWKRRASLTGLAGVNEGERSFDLRYGDATRIASVNSVGQHHEERLGKKYYWTCASGNGLKHHNTFQSGTFFDNAYDAKKACREYVKTNFVKPEAK